MKVLDAKISDSIATRNPHRLQLLVDRIPENNEMRYRLKERSDGSVSYFSDNEGYVSFGVWVPFNQNGYGGTTFEITDLDGEVHSFKGPWSSRPAVMHRVFGIRSLDISLTDDLETFKRGYTFYAAHCTVDLAMDALRIIQPKFYLAEVYWYDEWSIELFTQDCDFAFEEEEYEWKKNPDGTPNMQRRRVDKPLTGSCLGGNHFLEGRR